MQLPSMKGMLGRWGAPRRYSHCAPGVSLSGGGGGTVATSTKVEGRRAGHRLLSQRLHPVPCMECCGTYGERWGGRGPFCVGGCPQAWRGSQIDSGSPSRAKGVRPFDSDIPRRVAGIRRYDNASAFGLECCRRLGPPPSAATTNLIHSAFPLLGHQRSCSCVDPSSMWGGHAPRGQSDFRPVPCCICRGTPLSGHPSSTHRHRRGPAARGLATRPGAPCSLPSRAPLPPAPPHHPCPGTRSRYRPAACGNGVSFYWTRETASTHSESAPGVQRVMRPPAQPSQDHHTEGTHVSRGHVLHGVSQSSSGSDDRDRSIPMVWW